MTLAYERDPYLRTLATRVVASGEDEGRAWVALEDTILYPEGGGQPTDHGTVGEVSVRAVARVDGEVRHLVDEPVALGDVDVVLDWERRYDHMQQHTAQHLLSALFLTRHGWPTTSFHLGELRSDIELDVPSIEPEVLREIETEFMEKVRAAIPVGARRVEAEVYSDMNLRGRGLPADHSGSVRLVEIEGVDTTTCGGTHLRSTAEIESIHLGPVERMRGGTRLHWIAGGRVRRRLAELEERVGVLRQLFETSEGELLAAAGARVDSLERSLRRVRRLTGELAAARAAALASSPERVVEAHFEDADGRLLAEVGRALVEWAPVEGAGEKVALLTASGQKGHAFLIVAGPATRGALVEIGPRVAEILGGRGGGSGATFQGKAGSMEDRAEAFAALERFVIDRD